MVALIQLQPPWFLFGTLLWIKFLEDFGWSSLDQVLTPWRDTVGGGSNRAL